MPTVGSVVDLRSDTLTKPTAEMLQEMVTAPVGDDVWGDDPSVKKLEAYVAELAGKEAAVYCPSGTMCNLIALSVHSRVSSPSAPPEIVAGDKSHIALYEAGGISNTGAALLRQLPNNADGTMDTALIQERLDASAVNDDHFCHVAAVCLEDTHNKCGGVVLARGFVNRVRAMLDKHNAKTNSTAALHCDGARLWNSCVASGKSLSELCRPYDTVSLCLSKGLGAPIGSVLVGSTKFITAARRFRKMFGGGMRQAGVIASAGLFAVQRNLSRLAIDHATAKRMAATLTEKGFDVLPVHTNIVIWRTCAPGKAAAFVAACEKQSKVLLAAMGPSLVRAVPHLGNDHELDVDRLVRACVAARKSLVAASKL